MKILIACEYSGTVRDAFILKGHDVISCDLLPSEKPGPHYQGSVFDLVGDKMGGGNFDMMIAFPPCTYLSYAGTRAWYYEGRAEKRIEALQFFLKLWQLPIEKICLENPQGCATQMIAKHDQIIHPYYFGDPFEKRTCLWLKNLPKLKYNLNDNLFESATSLGKPSPQYYQSGRKKHCTDILSKGSGDERRKERARFWPSIAKAMAEQWG